MLTSWIAEGGNLNPGEGYGLEVPCCYGDYNKGSLYPPVAQVDSPGSLQISGAAPRVKSLTDNDLIGWYIVNPIASAFYRCQPQPSWAGNYELWSQSPQRGRPGW